jgi:hypothetical protein
MKNPHIHYFLRLFVAGAFIFTVCNLSAQNRKYVAWHLKGAQIGLWNKNQKRSLPFINWNFSN